MSEPLRSCARADGAKDGHPWAWHQTIKHAVREPRWRRSTLLAGHGRNHVACSHGHTRHPYLVVDGQAAALAGCGDVPPAAVDLVALAVVDGEGCASAPRARRRHRGVGSPCVPCSSPGNHSPLPCWPLRYGWPPRTRRLPAARRARARRGAARRDARARASILPAGRCPVTAPFDHVWWWHPFPRCAVDRKGQRFRVLARGWMNSNLVELADGYRVVTSRCAVMRAPAS
jgi:hypothetical protein